MTSRERFWTVIDPTETLSRAVFDDHALAVAEAKWLALAYPGQVFHVLASIEAYVKSDTERITFHEDVTIQEPPF